MSDIDDLAAELGVEEDIQESETIEKEASDISVITAKQVVASDKLIETCVNIYKVGRENDLAWRWMIGAEVDESYANEDLYEESILKRMSEELDIAVSDLSRFRKFHVSFDKEMVIERAQVGYTWSHFKIVNDLQDGDIKTRMIAMIGDEDEAPKIKDLQQTICDEKEAQFGDEDGSGGLGGTSGEAVSSGPSLIKPVSASLKLVDKLLDNLSDLFIQEQSGMDFDTDTKGEKYKEAMDELSVRLDEVKQIHNKIWKLVPDSDDVDEEIDAADTED